MDLVLGLFLVAVLIVGLLAIGILGYTHRMGVALNKEEYQRHWLGIERRLQKDQSSTYHLAIIEADKLLDKALRERRFKGDTMGARMKSAQVVWKNANHIWGAHKVRNRVVHETDIELSYEIVARSMAAYKQGLKDLGAI